MLNIKNNIAARYLLENRVDDNYARLELFISVIILVFVLLFTSQVSLGGADGDGLPASAELCDGLYVNSGRTGTCDTQAACDLNACVLSTDYDDDGLSDFAERNWGNNTGSYVDTNNTGTNPLVADTDGDGANDNRERCTGSFGSASDIGTCPTITSCTNSGICSSPTDFDGDTHQDGVDTCPVLANAVQTDTDGDGRGNACDNDDDNDGVLDAAPDACPTGDTGWISDIGTDRDGDGCRDAGAEDPDDDNDGVPDGLDSCPIGEIGWTSSGINDNDSDGCRDSTEDLDDDNDGVPDLSDNCQTVPNPDQANNDPDANGDACDNNDDGDSLNDTADACPLNPLSGQPIPASGVDIGCDLMCFRPHVGVPGQPQPPTIDGAIADDVGWRGAHRVTFGNGTDVPHVGAQVLRDNSSSLFYMSFEVKNDTGVAAAGDTVVVTFRPSFNPAAGTTDGTYPAGNLANDIRIIIEASSTDTTVAKHNGTSWVNLPTLPTGMVVQRMTATGTWDIEVALPTTIAAGGAGWVDFGPYFKFYFNVIRETGGTATEFVWPDYQHRILGNINTYTYDNHEWGIGTQDNAAQCNGVFLTATDIGTTNTPANSINLDSANTFFANVKNLTWDSATSNWAAANDINVRFRIADWGMAGVGNLTSSSWREIPAANDGCGTADSNDNPTCEQNVPAATNSTTPGQQTFNLDWTVSTADKPRYQDPPEGMGDDHQCILVELNSKSGANITTKSVYRNMIFDATASKFEQMAKIDAQGLPKPPAGKSEHQFILQEVREVLPPVLLKDYMADLTKQKRAVRNDDVGTHVPDFKGKWLSQTRWLIHGYRETGMFVEIKGVKYPLTEPVSSFGYVISHAGDAVKEWKYGLEGGGINKTAEGFYKLAIPEGGFKRINTRVDSVELSFLERLLEFLKHYWWLLLLLLIIVIAWWIYKNKS